MTTKFLFVSHHEGPCLSQPCALQQQRSGLAHMWLSGQRQQQRNSEDYSFAGLKLVSLCSRCYQLECLGHDSKDRSPVKKHLCFSEALRVYSVSPRAALHALE